MQYFKQWQEGVNNRISNPGQALATALQESYPSQENPFGSFGGVGSIGKIGRMTRGMFDLNKGAEASVFRNPLSAEQPNILKDTARSLRNPGANKYTLADNKTYYETPDGFFVDEFGKVAFKDKQELMDVARDIRIRMEMQKSGTNKYHDSMKYGDPFGDTTR